MTLLWHYKFDHENVTLDSSGNSSHLSNIGVTTTIDSTHGRVALFNGRSFLRRSKADNRSRNSPRTISLWVNPRIESGAMFDLGGMVRNERFATYLYSGGLTFLKSFASAQENSYPGLSVDRWYHIAVAFDGSNFTMYQDGFVLGTTFSADDESDNRVRPVRMLTIGRFSNKIPKFTGKMADLRMYDYALDSTEISNMVSSGPGATTAASTTPGTMKVQGKTSTSLSFLIEGDPKSTYKVEVGGRIVDNIKTGETIVVEGLASNTEYTANLY